MKINNIEKISKPVHFLGQIAFGVGDIDANPELFEMFKYCREVGVIPNVTINGDRLTDDIVTDLAALCGAVAVSRYNPSDVCYNAIDRLNASFLKSKIFIRKNN